jgi:putative salt-induced outer membrane protein YdiY
VRSLAAGGLILALSVTAFADGDVVMLRNGDRLSGTIAKLEGGKLIMATPYANEIVISWEDVVGLQSQTAHIVRIGPDNFVHARFTIRKDGVFLESDDFRSARPVALEQVASIDIPPGARWNFAVDGSILGTKGNSDSLAWGFGAEAQRKTDDDRLRFGVRHEYAESSHIGSTKNTRGFIDFNHDFTPVWYGKLFGSLEHDKFKDLDLRTVVAAGPGYHFINTKALLLNGYAGLAYINENFIRNANDRSYVSLVLGDEFRWFLTNSDLFYQTLDVYPSLEDTSDVLFQLGTGVRHTIIKGLFVDLGISDDYDTKPALGFKKNDFRYHGRLGYLF